MGFKSNKKKSEWLWLFGSSADNVFQHWFWSGGTVPEHLGQNLGVFLDSCFLLEEQVTFAQLFLDREVLLTLTHAFMTSSLD